MSATGDLSKFIVNLVFKVLNLLVHWCLRPIYGGRGEVVPPIDNLLLLDSATAIAAKIRSRKVTSEEVVRSYISRIQSVNPVLNIVVDERFEAAIEEAKRVDELVKSGTKSPQEMAEETPFLGVPVTCKDSIGVHGLSNTAGLYARRLIKAPEDSDAMAWMRRAGAIPLAVTNISELCMFWESNNKVYGRSCNPYNTNRIVGGSSGGEGALQGCAGSPMGLGSDIGGSIRMPAYFNGVFGHKPSTGVGSLKGHVPMPSDPIQLSYLVIGPMSRHATDLLPMLKVLAPHNKAELRLEEKVDIKSLKYFYMEDDTGGPLVSPVEADVRRGVRRVVDYLQRTHNITAQHVTLSRLRHSMTMWFAKMKMAGPDQMPSELADRKGEVDVYRELAKLPLGLSHHTLPVLAVAVLEKFNVEHGGAKHRHLVDMCEHLKMEFQDILGSDGVFIYPTHPTSAPYHFAPIIKPFNCSYTAIFNVLGLPATTVPLGLDASGLPIGVQVVGGLKQDRLTLAVAVELEKAFGGWVPPSLSV